MDNPTPAPEALAKELRALAEKASPAPWTIERYGDDECPSLVIHKDSESRICFMATPGSHGDPAKIKADAEFIVWLRNNAEAIYAALTQRPERVIAALEEAFDAQVRHVRELEAVIGQLTQPPPAAGLVEALAKRCWQDLLDKDDRNSPEDYPDMVLITYEELQDYLAESLYIRPAPKPSAPAQAEKEEVVDGMLPCPFCGEAAEIDSQHWNGLKPVTSAENTGWAIYCHNASCIGSPPFSRVHETEEEAKEAWNTRALSKPNAAPKHPAQGAMERLETVMRELLEGWHNFQNARNGGNQEEAY